MKYHIAFVCIILLSSSCSKKGEYITPEALERMEELGRPVPTCEQWSNYLPNENTPVKYVRINFHVMQKSDGTGNFDKKEGDEFIKILLYLANKALVSGNQKMNLPEGNDTPILPQRYQYILTPDDSKPNDKGIYYHKDDELYYMVKRGRDKNYYDKKVVEKYAINDDKVLNVFLLEHHSDSLNSSTYKADDMGVAVGTSVKLLGLKTDNETPLGKGTMGAWFTQGLLNHEVGHVLGLGHSWVTNDRCDDTPSHPNCWNFGAPPCSVVSNNFMDYNTYRNSWTPCQLGIIHKNFAKDGSRQRKLLIKDWCEFDEAKTVRINGAEIWEGARDLLGNLIINEGAELTISCRVNLPEKAKVIVRPGAKLILEPFGSIENDCGKEWEGIIVEKSKNKEGKVFCNNAASIKNAKHNFH